MSFFIKAINYLAKALRGGGGGDQLTVKVKEMFFDGILQQITLSYLCESVISLTVSIQY